MADEEGRVITSELGSIRIADEVVAVIAGLAATEVEGVSAMSGGFAGDIAEVLGRRNLSKGVKVEVGAEEAKIDLY
ncbi:MAG: Asp23/Gls24 family envelope stress response protein, partial [Dethiobacteria bacterium]